MNVIAAGSPPERTEVVVVGAGLAGLATARRLFEADRDVVVLEAADGVGGRVRTDVVHGHRLDRGFQVMLTGYPEFQIGFDIAALDMRTFAPGAKVWDGQRLSTVSDPLRRPSAAISSAVAPIGSLGDKLRVLRQRIRLQRSDPRQLLRGDDIATVDALRAEGFSEHMIERFFVPLVGGIQLDPSLATSRRMFDVIQRTLIVGEVGVPNLGMGEVSRQLASRLRSGSVHLGTPVREVAAGRVVTAAGHTVEADRVVVATEGPVASELLGLPPVASNPATCVWFAADRPPLTEPFIVLDASEDQPLNIAVMTNVASGYSGDGSAVIAAAVPGAFDPDAEASARARAAAIWGDEVAGWHHLRTDTISHGQPRQHPPFAPKQRVALGDGLFVCGDHRDTASIQGALFSGRRCAEAVLDSLT